MRVLYWGIFPVCFVLAVFALKDGHESLFDWVTFHVTAFLAGPRQMKISMRSFPEQRLIIETKTRPSFLSVVPDPSFDRVIPFFLSKTGVWEAHLTDLFRRLLLGRCDATSWVVDAGANNGYFGLYSAAMGCPVIAIEPQKRLTRLIEQAAHLNEFSPFEVYTAALSSEQGDVLVGLGNERWGGAQVLSEAMKQSLVPKRGPLPDYIREVPSITLDEIAGDRHIFLLKADCEGHELHIMQGAEKLLASKRVQNVILEIFRMSEGRAHAWLHFLEGMHNLGYTLRDSHEPDSIIPPAKFAEYLKSVEVRYENKQGVTEVFLSLT